MTSPQSTWRQSADRIESVLTDRFGAPPARASISFLGVEPIDILRYRASGRLVYCSLGMARRPMTPAGEQLIEMAGPRAELLIEVADPAGVLSSSDHRIEPADVWKALAVFAAAPAVEGVVYAPGMTVDSGRTVVPGSRCTGGLVLESQFEDIGTSVGLVSVLQLVPATAEELAWTRVHGVRELRRRWEEHGIDLLDLSRPSVPLE